MPGPTILSINANQAQASNANFRAWGSAISAALATAGWVQTADTGQINWTTVIVPSASTAAGYEIWKLNDTLQATAPIFLKIEYGGGPALGLPGLWTTVGTASDGAGTLTSTPGSGTSVTTRTTLHPANNTDTWPNTNLPVHVNGDGSSLVLALWPNATGPLFGMFFAVERFRNWDGTVNGDGFVVLYGNSSSTGLGSSKSQLVYFTTTVAQPGQATFVPAPTLNAALNASHVIGNTLYPAPVLPMWGGKVQGPMAMAMLVKTTDVAAGNNFSVTHYGVAHTFYGMGQGFNATSGYATTFSGSQPQSLLYRMD